MSFGLSVINKVMKKEEKQSLLTDISTLKKDLMMFRIKASSGETVLVKEFKLKKKAIARLFTKINDKNAVVETPVKKNNKKINKA